MASKKFNSKPATIGDLNKLEKRMENMLDNQSEQLREQVKEDTEQIFFKYKSELVNLVDPVLK